MVPQPRASALVRWTFDQTGAAGSSSLSQVPTMSASANAARNMGTEPWRMPSRRQNSSSAGKKLSPGSNRTPKVRPVVSSWLCIRLIIPSASGDRPGLVIVQAAGAERGGDLVAAGAAGKQDVQQQPGLEGI